VKSIIENVKKVGEVVVVGYGNQTDVKTQAAETNMVLLEKEANRVISSLPDFIPGEQNSKKVAVFYTLPITFRLN